MKKILTVTAVCMAAVMLLAGCKGKDEDKAPTQKPVRATERTESVSSEVLELTENTIDGVITLESGDTIEFELYPDLAPKTVANFVKNVQEGFYSGTIFHRAIENFVVQTGGFDKDFKRMSVSETVEGEFEANGIDNDLSHTRGVLSMARTNEMNSASTQFFIVHQDSDYLDGQYAAFGKVIGGMEVVDEIAECEKTEDPLTGKKEAPLTPYVIESIMIDTASDSDELIDETETATPQNEEE